VFTGEISNSQNKNFTMLSRVSEDIMIKRRLKPPPPMVKSKTKQWRML